MFQLLHDYIYGVFQNDLPFVVFKKPFENHLTIQIQKNTNQYLTSNFEENGFVFAPFDNNNPSYIIPTAESEFFNIPISFYSTKNNNSKIDVNENERKKHINKVNQCIDFIKSGRAKKVVISRKQFINKEKNDLENQLDVFLKLIHLYPEAMVYWWKHPSTNVWMGATPERLLIVNERRFQTMSLAGTQLYTDKIFWQEKEKMEQKLVTDYIIEKLEEAIDEIIIGENYTKKAGHLAHICTDIEGKIKPNKKILDLVNSLHPTPAVCGTPKESAFQYILNHEGYDRKFYTGFLGEVQLDKKTELFVNLRCMEWVEKGIYLYIGGGITAESIPEKEWEETVNKSQVMSKVI